MSIIDFTDSLSDDELLSSLQASVSDETTAIAAMITYLVAVEKRRLHLEMAYSSMFDFCTKKLGLSEGAAFRRIAAARLVQRFPQLLDAIAHGRIHLCNLLRLRELFTESNVDELINEATGKTKREVEELVARLAPKPDVKPSIRKLPEQVTLPASTDGAGAAHAQRDERTWKEQEVTPLSPARYKVQLTVDHATRDRLEHARSLMRHRNPTGDLEVLFAEALEALVEKLEKEKLGKTDKPRASRGSTDPGYVTRAARREVVERDGHQCSFVSATGERCSSRDFLEFDHRTPRALGGGGSASNVRMVCAAHNQHAAEQVFGRAHIEKRVHFHRRKYKPEPGSRDLVECALLRMGFRKAEVERALTALGPEAWARPVEGVLRDALAALT